MFLLIFFTISISFSQARVRCEGILYNVICLALLRLRLLDHFFSLLSLLLFLDFLLLLLMLIVDDFCVVF